jgi:SseB protein N-terminal domain/SseB protein C-terminal domain
MRRPADPVTVRSIPTCHTAVVSEMWEPTDNTGQPLRNQALVDAMQAVSIEDTPERRALLFHLLLDSTLIVATPDRPDAPRTRTAQPGEHLNLATLQDSDGTVLPVFISTAAVLAWRPEGGGIIALPARALLEMASAAGTGKVAINPASATFGYLTRPEIQALAKGRLPLGPAGEVVPEATQVRIGIPQEPPGPALLEALSEALRAEPAAERAWYFLMQQGQSEHELCVAVRLAVGVTGERERAAMRAVIDRASGHCEEVKTLAFMVAHGDLQANLQAGAGKQFFRRV